MTNTLRITKLEAARRQLSRAIRMLFDQDDPVCTHTLAGAASVVLADLVENKFPGLTWQERIQADNNLARKEYYRIAHRAQNFLKHADGDPDEVLEFDPSDTDALLTVAVFNASELEQLSPEANVFQLWSLALFCPDDLEGAPPFANAIAYFGRLRSMDRDSQLLSGRKGLAEFV